jgi:hypothetical protein
VQVGIEGFRIRQLRLSHLSLLLRSQTHPNFVRKSLGYVVFDVKNIFGLAPELTQTVKTLLAVRCKILDRQNDCSAYWFPAGEAEAGSAGAQPAEE